MEIDKYSKKFIHYYSGDIPFLIEEIFKKNNIKNLADLGSGDGAILYSLLKRGCLDKVEKVVAVDISRSRIEKVRKISSKILCVVADVCKLDMLPNASLDLIISNQVIEHVRDENNLIEGVSRALVKNGLFYLSTVYRKWYGWYFYRCKGKWVLDPTHLREYKDEEQLLSKFKKYNFKILENRKTLQWFPLTDFFLKRIGKRKDVYSNKFMRFLRSMKIPILGYYNWELIFKNI